MSKDAKKTTAEEKPEVTTDETVESPEDTAAEELKKSQEQYLRLAAEYDNFRKRSVKEKENTFQDAKVTVFTELLPVLDNFERALGADQSSLEDFKKGVEMTQSQLLAVFEKFGIESFGTANDKFDPNFHNAVMHVEDDSLEAGVIAEVFQKGYKVGDRVLRPAMVKVAN